MRRFVSALLAVLIAVMVSGCSRSLERASIDAGRMEPADVETSSVEVTQPAPSARVPAENEAELQAIERELRAIEAELDRMGLPGEADLDVLEPDFR